MFFRFPILFLRFVHFIKISFCFLGREFCLGNQRLVFFLVGDRIDFFLLLQFCLIAENMLVRIRSP